jgi:hypothetical protein
VQTAFVNDAPVSARSRDERAEMTPSNSVTGVGYVSSSSLGRSGPPGTEEYRSVVMQFCAAVTTVGPGAVAAVKLGSRVRTRLLRFKSPHPERSVKAAAASP